MYHFILYWPYVLTYSAIHFSQSLTRVYNISIEVGCHHTIIKIIMVTSRQQSKYTVSCSILIGWFFYWKYTVHGVHGTAPTVTYYYNMTTITTNLFVINQIYKLRKLKIKTLFIFQNKTNYSITLITNLFKQFNRPTFFQIFFHLNAKFTIYIFYILFFF